MEMKLFVASLLMMGIGILMIGVSIMYETFKK